MGCGVFFHLTAHLLFHPGFPGYEFVFWLVGLVEIAKAAGVAEVMRTVNSV